MARLKKSKENYPMMVVFILAAEVIGSIGSLATAPNIPTWYTGLIKPPLNPPSWVFGPVWTLLFALMGIAAYRIYRSKAKTRTIAMRYFISQFALNVVWSFLFFGSRAPELAFVEIVILWMAIILTIREFRKIDPVAGYLLYPYLAWVSFASYLNLGVSILN